MLSLVNAWYVQTNWVTAVVKLDRTSAFFQNSTYDSINLSRSDDGDDDDGAVVEETMVLPKAGVVEVDDEKADDDANWLEVLVVEGVGSSFMVAKGLDDLPVEDSVAGVLLVEKLKLENALDFPSPSGAGVAATAFAALHFLQRNDKNRKFHQCQSILFINEKRGAQIHP